MLVAIVFIAVAIIVFLLPIPKYKKKQLEEMQRIIIFGE